MTRRFRQVRPRGKSEVLAKASKRIFLEDGLSMSAATFYHSVSTYVWDSGSPTFYGLTELKLYLGGAIIKLHSCDLGSQKYGLEDFIRKLNVIIKVLNKAINFLDHQTKHQRLIIKEFLNPDEGLIDLYTSMIAVTVTQTHGITFEIASCDLKRRIVLSPRGAKRFFNRLKGFLEYGRSCIEETLTKHNDKLVYDEHETPVTR